MSKKPFTAEEIIILRQNPFTYKVTNSRLFFTKEFKELFITEYNAGNFSGRSTVSRRSKNPDKVLSEKDELKRLRQEVDYLKQEMEFLKKFLDQNYTEVGELLMNDSSCVFEIIYNTMQNSNNLFSVKELCAIAGVSRSGYYAWVKAASIREQQEIQDQADFELILAAYKMHGYTKGARGIYMALLHMDTPVIMNLKKIRRLMHKYHLVCLLFMQKP